MSGSATFTPTADEQLREACARNTPAELRYEKHDGTVVTARVRLLQLDGNRILADAPQYSQPGEQILPGRSLQVYLVIGNSRYQFESAIEDPHVRFSLNAQTRIVGISLRKPPVVVEAQRRANYRLPLLGLDVVPVVIVSPHPKIADACLVDAEVWHGLIVDLSAGGCATLVDKDKFPTPSLHDRFYLTFSLPGVDGEFLMLAAVRHTVMIARSESLRIGMAFLPWAGCDLPANQKRLYRFVADQQRRLLRRKK